MPVASPAEFVTLRGARTHNLRGINLDLPRSRIVVISGVSGSGKSSLAIDTLHAEGRYRFLEALSAAGRPWREALPRPDVDWLSGLPPTLALGQRQAGLARRETLATLTGLYDFLRLLYARGGVVHCPKCGGPVSRQTAQAIVDGILALEAGRKVMLLAPLVTGRKGAHRQLFERVVRDGFVRARVDGVVVDAASPPPLAASRSHTIDLVVDRVVVKEGLRARLHESVLLALKHGQDRCIVSRELGTGWEDRLFSSRYACPVCHESIGEVEPRTFSFNSPHGACPECTGTGLFLGQAGNQARHGARRGAARPVRAAESQAPCPECRGARLGPVARAVTYLGMPIHQVLAMTVEQAAQHAAVARGAVENLSADAAPGAERLADPAALVGRKLLPEVLRRLEFLRRVGLPYLTLDRPVATLSGGELQRARLAGALGSGLRGICYIIDEPTHGLHPRDTQRLVNTLQELRDQGNSLIIVEHDVDVIGQADLLVDLGPGAGREGGRVVAAGTPQEVAANPASLTGKYLLPLVSGQSPARAAPLGGTSGENADAAAPQQWPARAPRMPDWSRVLTVRKAALHNLKSVTVTFPAGLLTVVAGVSGSGKSSLVVETLVPGVRRALAERSAMGPREAPAGPAGPAAAAVDVPEEFSRLVLVDQAPIGRGGRSNPATATGAWEGIRRLFASTRDARLRGMPAARFSFNSRGGRCEACQGFGTRRINVRYLPEVTITCPACRGARFHRQVLEVKYKGHSVADVLNMRVDEAAGLFANVPGVSAILNTLAEVGLGYLALGQSADTLSGGEAQRIKLARELCGRQSPAALYVLDEPTTGLHPSDVDQLLLLLNRLVDQGNTVIVIEHHPQVMAAADYLIELGPDGGPGGGEVVAAGTPGQVAANAASHTGRALAERAAALLAVRGV